MEKRIRLGLVGDFSEKIYTHVKLNEAIEHCKPQLPFSLEASWVPTESINTNFLTQHNFDGFWLTPGSPYRNDGGVYQLIEKCRVKNHPLFGTCGGFQYMLIEYARNVLGLSKAAHEESEPEREQLVISKMTCHLKGRQEEVIITDKQSWLYQVLKSNKLPGYFNCSYGVNPAFQSALNQYPMVFTAFSPLGEPRALELKTHRFYKATLFQPPLDSTFEKPNLLMQSFFNQMAPA